MRFFTKILKTKIMAAVILLSSISLPGQKLPYQNPELSSEERAKDLISRET